MPSRLACKVFGHRYRFSAEGPVMVWRCQRACGAGGEKRYASPADAARYAVAFDQEDRENIGRRPTLGTTPLWLWRRLRLRRERRRGAGG
jgi:hypothetical protein